MTTASRLVTYDDVVAARELIRDVVRATPMENSRPLEGLVGGPVHLKCENLQRTGSFKIRGAYVRIARLDPSERAAGVVAASAGNHAQGVALAADFLGAKATIFMPEGAPLPKVAATRAYGADVQLVGASIDDSLVAAQRYSTEQGAVFVHPFDHPDIIAGQGTVGLEILEQVPDVRTIVVPVGGGGLISGIAAAVRGASDANVVGVQAEGAACYPPSLEAGHPVALSSYSTMADGIAVGRPGDLTFPHIASLVDGVRTVSDEDISRALLLCLERAKLVVEPAGAAGVAAVMAAPKTVEPPVVVVLSGGNIDPLLLLRVLRHGMTAAGRYMSFRVRIPDRPGNLAGLLDVLASTQANVLDVEHVRTGSPSLHIHEVEVALQIETRGPTHCEEVLAKLREAGYPLALG